MAVNIQLLLILNESLLWSMTPGDIDGDGNVDALTDGLLLLRYLFGLSGDTLTVGVVASNATRTTASGVRRLH